MKENSISNEAKNTKEPNHMSLSKAKIPDINNFLNSIYSFKSSYGELKESKIIEISIFNTNISTKQYPQPNKYLTQDDISYINELKEKYKDSSMNSIKNSLNIFNDIAFNSLSIDDIPLPQFPQDLLNKDLNPLSFPQKNNCLPFLFNTSGINNIFPFPNNNFLLGDNIFLNHKRKKLNDERKRKYKTNLVFISNRKSKIKNENENENEEKMNNELDEEINKKKIIFRLSKGEKSKNKIRAQKEFNLNREKKQPGRKKKNSGEVGTHNKFSKDNMMRKLKNKVMESSRKLINNMIRKESGNELRFYREIRKIEGVYSQELNIKFNFWFYFQKLKDIFQFNMSQKYSKGDLDSNMRLIQKIYSIDKFVRTRKLLEMKFHEYYHNIFLGENKNWPLYYGITDNKYQLDYFLNNASDNEKDKDYFLYRKTLYNLACKYELFFLKKNPRLTGNKKKEDKESHAKLIIRDINNEQFDYLKYLFIQTGSFYNAEIGNIYRKYLNDNRNKYFLLNPYHLYSSSFFNKNNIINSNLQNKDSIHNNSKTMGKTQNKIYKNNNIQENNTKHNSSVNSKKLLFEITKQTNDKNSRNKNSSFIVKNSLKTNLINNLDSNIIESETKQNGEKEIQAENKLNNEDSSHSSQKIDIEIVI